MGDKPRRLEDTEPMAQFFAELGAEETKRLVGEVLATDYDGDSLTPKPQPAEPNEDTPVPG